MSIIPSGQKFHTVPSSVNTQEKGSALANSQREIYTMQDIIDSVPSGGVQSVVAGTNITVDDTDPANPIVSASGGGGGGGIQGVHALVPLSSGDQINASITAQANTTANAFANRLTAYPFIPAQNITTSNLYIFVNTLAVGALGRILIYSDLNGKPDQKLYESANLDCSTTGNKFATTTFNFVAGTTYWLCFHSSSTPTLTAQNTTSLIPIKVVSSTSMANHYYAIPPFGSAPTTFVIVGTQTTTPPFIGITKA